MKIRYFVLDRHKGLSLQSTLIFLLFFLPCLVFAQESNENETVPPGGARMRVLIENGDTIFVANIREVTVFPPMVFRNRREEQHYWRTVRDVRRTLPLANLVGREVIATNQHLLSLPDDRARRAYLDEFERELFRRHEAELRRLTISQGRMLIRLIDREVDKTSYELIRLYRGRITAGFWQGVARIFGTNLRTSFNLNNEEDQMIERIIIKIEAGVL